MPTSAITITATYRIIVANGNVATSALKAWTQNGILHINGLMPGEPWGVYSLTGNLIYTGIATGSETTIALPGRGGSRFFLGVFYQKKVVFEKKVLFLRF